MLTSASTRGTVNVVAWTWRAIRSGSTPRRCSRCRGCSRCYGVRSSALLHRREPLPSDQRAPRIDEAPVAGEAPPCRGIGGKHACIGRQQRATGRVGLDAKVHGCHREPKSGKCPELVRHAGHRPAWWRNHGGSEDELSLHVIREAHERGAEGHVENRQMLRRVQNVFGTLPPESANGCQSPKEPDVGRGDFVQRAPDLCGRGFDVPLVVLEELEAREDLSESASSGRLPFP